MSINVLTRYNIFCQQWCKTMFHINKKKKK